ncbi:Programmed cell death protein 7 [Dillenia turbinata]|uniref:Programmed cell death protein 7 n=1 Tax=Dillenia turbinata TaxID=194707 RepID=A0AAN8UXY4_9MAGN
MNLVPFPSTAQQAPWFPPPLPPNPPVSSTFWNSSNIRDWLKELHETLNLAIAMQKELELLQMIKDEKRSPEDMKKGLDSDSMCRVLKVLEDNSIDLISREMASLEAANAIMSRLRTLVEPFRVVTDEASPWEEKSAAVRLANKIQKSKRNKLWRKRKRKHAAEMLSKERELFDQVDQEADEWRAREIAKDIAKRKVEKMKEIAKLKAKEEKNKLESEELRSIRIEKLKRQGHFLPEEDDKFFERVRAAVEEEERQAMVKADTDAARDAIATAEESRKMIQSHGPEKKSLDNNRGGNDENRVQDQQVKDGNQGSSGTATDEVSIKQGSEGHGHVSTYDSVANLPIEFYHYYHGSNTDMGTLIEVRRTWDAYIRPGGSRIPGNWVHPPPPADDVWASYLVRPK